MSETLQLILLITIGITFLCGWMTYIWWFRGVVLDKRFCQIFGVNESINTAEIKNGKIRCIAKIRELNIYLYSVYNIVGTRNVWYLIVESPNKVSDCNGQKFYYGNGLGTDLVFEGLEGIECKDKIVPKSDLGVDVLPEIVLIDTGNELTFYRLPDFFGSGVMHKVYENLK